MKKTLLAAAIATLATLPIAAPSAEAQNYRERDRYEGRNAYDRQGRYRPGFEVVRRAVLACVPDADAIWALDQRWIETIDSDRGELPTSGTGTAARPTRP